ncbi:MAG: rhomboid family intramembrane serine protease [Paludibacteraceae bacterium]|nr:rhomboid family intramembrane serine protease [Paludibacteraceae bacterium]
MSLKDDIVKSFKEGSLLTKLIYVNIAAFVFVNLILVVYKLIQIECPWVNFLMLPSDLNAFILHPWTIITYMFMHTSFIHILFNVLMLYWFGQLFMTFFNQRDLVGVYVIGGLAGGLFYLLAFNLVPYYIQHGSSYLLGASASVMAIVVATAVMSPDYQVRIPLIGMIKIEWIAVASVLISLLGITSTNAGGELAHLGGALIGYIFAKEYKKGTNIVGWINKLIDWLVDLPKKKSKMKVSYENQSAQRETDAEYNARKKQHNDEIDRILDKIKQSGYDSLSDNERKQLFGK